MRITALALALCASLALAGCVHHHHHRHPGPCIPESPDRFQKKSSVNTGKIILSPVRKQIGLQ